MSVNPIIRLCWLGCANCFMIFESSEHSQSNCLSTLISRFAIVLKCRLSSAVPPAFCVLRWSSFLVCWGVDMLSEPGAMPLASSSASALWSSSAVFQDGCAESDKNREMLKKYRQRVDNESCRSTIQYATDVSFCILKVPNTNEWTIVWRVWSDPSESVDHLPRLSKPRKETLSMKYDKSLQNPDSLPTLGKYLRRAACFAAFWKVS